MRAKRRTEQEQYEIIMECRQSGLSDHQWCLEHDINPGTFYNWVLQIGQAVLRISNQTDPRLLEQTLKLIGAFSC